MSSMPRKTCFAVSRDLRPDGFRERPTDTARNRKVPGLFYALIAGGCLAMLTA